MSKKLSTKEFIQKARLVHGVRYDYSKVVYVNNKTKVIIGCPIHGDFEQKPTSHLQGNGCKKCNHNIPSTEEFIQKARSVHGDKYDYSKVVYVNNYTKIIIICTYHGEFLQKPYAHISNKSGCCKCASITNSQKLILKKPEFIKKANIIHNNKYDYSKIEYTGAHKKVIIICEEHGDFKQTPNDHGNNRNGCPKCSNSNYSQKAIDWLNQIIKEQGISIQHAENEGEYLIPGTKYKADGYCKENNTIYEFYGDRFHGNLNLFEENEQCHPFINESAGSLYMKTINREKEIKNLGYNLIIIWENDYKYL